MTVRASKQEGSGGGSEISLLVCCALLCCECVIRLKMSLVQTVTPRQCGIVGICEVECVRIDFGGFKKSIILL